METNSRQDVIYGLFELVKKVSPVEYDRLFAPAYVADVYAWSVTGDDEPLEKDVNSVFVSLVMILLEVIK